MKTPKKIPFNIQPVVAAVQHGYTWGDIVPKANLEIWFNTQMPHTGTPGKILNIHRMYNRRAGALKREMIQQHKKMLIATTKPTLPGYYIVKSPDQHDVAAGHYKAGLNSQLRKIIDRIEFIEHSNLTAAQQKIALANLGKTQAMIKAILADVKTWGL